MNVKEHYDDHLGNFFSWMSGDFTEKQREQQNLFASHKVRSGFYSVSQKEALNY